MINIKQELLKQELLETYPTLKAKGLTVKDSSAKCVEALLYDKK